MPDRTPWYDSTMGDSKSGPDEDIVGACYDGDAGRVGDILSRDRSQANARDQTLGTTPLIVTAHRGYREIVELLLTNHAGVAARERASGTIALHWAAEGGTSSW